jgi:hypothetical protein
MTAPVVFGDVINLRGGILVLSNRALARREGWTRYPTRSLEATQRSLFSSEQRRRISAEQAGLHVIVDLARARGRGSHPCPPCRSIPVIFFPGCGAGRGPRRPRGGSLPGAVLGAERKAERENRWSSLSPERLPRHALGRDPASLPLDVYAFVRRAIHLCGRSEVGCERTYFMLARRTTDSRRLS